MQSQNENKVFKCRLCRADSCLIKKQRKASVEPNENEVFSTGYAEPHPILSKEKEKERTDRKKHETYHRLHNIINNNTLCISFSYHKQFMSQYRRRSVAPVFAQHHSVYLFDAAMIQSAREKAFHCICSHICIGVLVW